ncbi:MAG TPA: dihydrofolate reductase [Verrucomicrobiae bacterium]|nr:dihydrofolate reductase [Verrucomicrobiae bacterium]
MKHFKAIAAMSLNRVIGQANRIPWHLPEDFKWFKKMTMGQVVVMGRRTFESIGKPLPHRLNLVLTRNPEALMRERPALYGGVPILQGLAEEQLAQPRSDAAAGAPIWSGPSLMLVSSLDQIRPDRVSVEVFICGGARLYEQTLAHCSDLFLTLVKRNVDGDAFFPAFESGFELRETILDRADFEIRHYHNQQLAPGPASDAVARS